MTVSISFQNLQLLSVIFACKTCFLNFIDTHTHLYLKDFDPDRAAVVQKAIEQGVSSFFLPNIDRFSITDMMSLVRQFPGHCFPMIGLHPCSVDKDYREELQAMEEWLGKEKFYAIGEIGIDLYWDKTHVKEQKDAFRYQIGLAKKNNLPIVIHLRNSFHEVYEIVNELNDENLSGIFHCFSGSLEEAQKIIGLEGFMMGIGGVVTFKNSILAKVIADIPLEYLVLETDSPYLTPEPFRGKRNESSYLIYIARRIAEAKGISLEEVAEATTRNAKKVFKFNA